MTDTSAALSYLKAQMGEGWELGCDSFERDEWVACAWKGGRNDVRVRGYGPDYMSAARACVEAWREATTALRENLEFRENDLKTARVVV